MIVEVLKAAAADLAVKWSELSVHVDFLQTKLAPSPELNTINFLASQVKDGEAAAKTSARGLDDVNSLARVLGPVQLIFDRAADYLNSVHGTIDEVGTGGLLKGLFVHPDLGVSSVARRVEGALDGLSRLVADTLQGIEEVTSPQGQGSSLAGIRGSMDALTTYPMFTQDLANGSGGGYSGFGSGGSQTPSGSNGRMVLSAMRDVLGRQPRLADTKSFVAALERSFSTELVEGHTVVNWTPNAGVGLSELGGAVTGAQASLWQQAKNARDQILPLLEGLTPLLSSTDDEMTEAVRSILRTEIEEVVKEIGQDSGPRVQRVDDLFDILLEADFFVLIDGVQVRISDQDPRAAKMRRQFGAGEVGRLGYLFGFTTDNVNTIEEELNLTQFLVMLDELTSLQSSWERFRSGFVGGADNYLGTQLVHIQRALGVMAEQVSEVAFAMDSVFLGPAERKTVTIDFPTLLGFGSNGSPASPPPMLVDDLLSWVYSFAADEAPSIITDGGKLGVRTITPTLLRLRDLTRAAIGRINHPGARHPRVRRTMEELVSQVDQAARLAGTIS